MNDKSLKILLGIIAVNLTLQTINQIGLFPTTYAQYVFPPPEPLDVLRIAICESDGLSCATVGGNYDGPLEVEVD